MSNSDAARGTFQLMEAHDFDGAEALMTDDFKSEGPVPEPVDRDGFLALQRAMATAFPDWSFQARDFSEQGDTGVHVAPVQGGGMPGILTSLGVSLP